MQPLWRVWWIWNFFLHGYKNIFSSSLQLRVLTYKPILYRHSQPPNTYPPPTPKMTAKHFHSQKWICFNWPDIKNKQTKTFLDTFKLCLIIYINTHTRVVQKVSDLNFFRLNKSTTESVLHCGCGGDIYAHAWIFSRLQIASVACSRSMTVYVLWALGGLSIIAKWRNELSSVIALNFAKSLAILKLKLFKDSTGFRGLCHEYHTNKRVVQPLQRWRHISGQRTTSR